MATFKTLSLENQYGYHFRINEDYLKQYENEILSFLSDEEHMKTIEFAKSVLFNEEIKFNNNIEGINNDIDIIDEVIRHRQSKGNEYENKRIINLYKGYKYILKHSIIDRNHLKELYNILSDGLLIDSDKSRMGEYYRTGTVYILKGGHLVDPYMRRNDSIQAYLADDTYHGVEPDKIAYLMDNLFEYINNDTPSNEISKFIKSQIMHFYFVYIHPYFDVNGRTSRTVSMWYLLNNKVYPYIIFNRAIAFSQKAYSENILKAKTSKDITLFLKYMLESVLIALEKQYLIDNIKEISGINLTKEDEQVLDCFLSLKGILTVKDLTITYNNYNNSKKVREIYRDKVLPLIDKGILLNLGNTKSYIDKNTHNIRIALNSKNIDANPAKVKHLKLDNYIK